MQESKGTFFPEFFHVKSGLLYIKPWQLSLTSAYIALHGQQSIQGRKIDS